MRLTLLRCALAGGAPMINATVRICAVLLLAATTVPAQSMTVADFLKGCGDGRMPLSQTPCAYFVTGVVAGTIVAEARNGIPHRYCYRGALTGEIADAYGAFVQGNRALLGTYNTGTFIKFLDARYVC